MIIIAVFIVGASYLYYYIVTNHKGGIAAIPGVATVVDVVNGGGSTKVNG